MVAASNMYVGGSLGVSLGQSPGPCDRSVTLMAVPADTLGASSTIWVVVSGASWESGVTLPSKSTAVSRVAPMVPCSPVSDAFMGCHSTAGPGAGMQLAALLLAWL